jgi:multidrug transporter EmrE-like cation transporter
MQVWILLAVAIAFEVAGTLLLKASNGFEKIGLGMAAIG